MGTVIKGVLLHIDVLSTSVQKGILAKSQLALHTQTFQPPVSMYAIAQPSSAPVHTFGTGAGTGPPSFGTSNPAGPKTFTGGGTPLSAPPGDMGNVLTHKQSARVVVDQSVHIGDYDSQCKTLVEKEFAVIQLNCRNDLHASTPPGENAVISSLARTNWAELRRIGTTHRNHKGDREEDMLSHLNSANYAPFGPVIQTDSSPKRKFGEKKCVTNIAVGGRANFSNCFIRTAGCTTHKAKPPINIGDGVFMASFLFTCDDGALGADAAYRTFNFLIVDNDYSMVPRVPSAVQIPHADGQQQPAMALHDFITGCMGGVDESAKLCQTLCCAFENPGVNVRNAGRCGDMHIHIACTSVSCVGAIIECPIPNAHVEHPQRILKGMISNEATMSTTHPVVVQMTS